MRLVIASYKGMVTVDSLNFHFGYDPNMYQGGVAGMGLQVDACLVGKEKILEDKLSNLAKAMLELEEEINK